MKVNKKVFAGIGGGLLAVAAAILIVISGGKKRAAQAHEIETKMAQQDAPKPVRLERVRATRRAEKRTYPGIVRASEETALSFRVGGPLVEVNVKLGQPVKKGELLMQIDPRDFKDRIASLEARLSGAVALQENARQDFQRISGLFEEKVVPQADFDLAKSRLDSAESAVKNLDVQLQIARHALEDTALRAPYDGTVTEQLVENHEMISPNRVVLHYHDIQTLEIVVNIPENEAASAPMTADGVRVAVSFPALRNETFEARLTEWSTRADALTRTYAAIFEMEAPDGGRILPGMTANVDLSTADDRSLVLTVPVSALVSDLNGGSFVWIYNDVTGRAERRSVTVGALNGAARVEIPEGLSENEQVVVAGSRLIHRTLSLKTASVQ